MEVEEIKAQLNETIERAYYMNPKMVRFLLLENLTLKTLLHEKGLFTPEEYKECQRKSESVMNRAVNSQIARFSHSNPEIRESIKDAKDAVRSEDPQSEDPQSEDPPLSAS